MMNSAPSMTIQTMIGLEKTIRAEDEQAVAALKAAGRGRDIEKINDAAQDFEAQFTTSMLQPMFEDIQVDPVFGGGKGEEMFRGLMLGEYGKLMARTGQLGVADMVRHQMLQIQEESLNAPATKTS